MVIHIQTNNLLYLQGLLSVALMHFLLVPPLLVPVLVLFSLSLLVVDDIGVPSVIDVSLLFVASPDMFIYCKHVRLVFLFLISFLSSGMMSIQVPVAITLCTVPLYPLLPPYQLVSITLSPCFSLTLMVVVVKFCMEHSCASTACRCMFSPASCACRSLIAVCSTSMFVILLLSFSFCLLLFNTICLASCLNFS